MLTATRGTSLDALVSSRNPPSLTRAKQDNSATSFAQQLANSLESYLGSADAGAHLEIDILPQSGANSGTRQFIVTVKDAGKQTSPAPAPVQAPAADASSAKPKIDVSGMLMFSGIPDPAKDTGPVEEPVRTETDAYWASQPEAVRVLRTIQDPVERGNMGLKLAQEGYIIDPNIMIHGWDPYMTMKIRKEEGYTWIPAVGQNGIPVSPGISFPGLPSYDPHNPPPGAVRVTTDFAVGLEHTSPGGRPAHPGDAIFS